jgi:hypothetical protein
VSKKGLQNAGIDVFFFVTVGALIFSLIILADPIL